MQKLRDANLYNSDLLRVSGSQVQRYNRCLEQLGIKPTTLKTFSIDGMGWSPEIAEKKVKVGLVIKAGSHITLVPPHGAAQGHGIAKTPLRLEYFALY